MFSSNNVRPVKQVSEARIRTGGKLAQPLGAFVTVEHAVEIKIQKGGGWAGAWWPEPE